MAAEVRDLPGQSDGETGVHHPMAHGETAGMNRGDGSAVAEAVVRGGKVK